MFTKFQISLLFILFLGLLPNTQAQNNFNIVIQKTGNGTVVSSPTGINCGTSCDATYNQESIVKITAIAKTGAEFTNWSGDCTGTSNPTYVIMNANKSCTANFKSQPIEIFDLTVVKTEHGTVTSEPSGINCGATCTTQHDNGKSVILRATPDDGYSFGGWGGDCDSSTALSLPIDMDASKTCTASFQLLPFKLVVKKDGSGTGRVTSNFFGIDCGEICEANYEKGKEVILATQPGENSTFAGWGGDCVVLDVSPTSAKVTMDEEKACTASFKLLPHNLKVAKMGNGTIISQPSGINCGINCTTSYEHGTEVTLTATPEKDYEFIGWTGSCAAETNDPSKVEKSATVIIDDDRSCTAQFKRLPVELAIAKNGNGTITSQPEGIDCGTKCTESFEYGKNISLTAVPDVDHEFSGWQGDCEGTSGSERLTLFSAKQCTAYFAPLPSEGRYNLTVVTQGKGNGTISSNPEGIEKCETVCTALYDENITVMLTAIPQANSFFKAWGEDCFGSSEDNCTEIDDITTCTSSVTLTRSKTCMAYFESEAPAFELSVTTSGDGFGTVKSDLPGIDCDECKAHYQQGTTVTLTAIPQVNSIFTGWINHCSGTNQSVSVTIEEAMTCTAVFEILPVYNFTITSIGSGHGGVVSDIEGVSCGDNCTQYPKDARIALTAMPEPDSRFMMWGGVCTGTESPVSILLDGVKECTALFELKSSHGLTITNIGEGLGNVERGREGVNCGEGCRAHFEGETVILTATAKEGSTFTEWGGHCSGTESPYAIVIDEAKTCTANFEALPTYQLTAQKIGNGTITSDPDGIDCGTACSKTYYGDTVVTLTATPSIGSKFTSWNGDCTGETSSFTVTMDAAKNCTANFEVLPPSILTVTKAGVGSGTVVVEPSLGPINCAEITCTEEYAANTEVTLTATPLNIDFAFSGWSGDCASADSVITMTLDTNKSCTANFERLAPPGNHNLSVTTSPNNGIITSEPAGINCGATCTMPYLENTVVTLTPTPNDGFIFTRWSGDCASPTAQLPVVMNAPKICMAHFVTVPPPGSHYLTVVKTGEGTISSDVGDLNCGNECSILYPEGTTVTLTAKPQPFAQFTGWGGNCIETDLEATVTLNTPQTCTANFDPVPSSVQFLLPEYRVNEIEGKAEIRVTRAASKRGAISVNYTITDLSATAGMDYLTVNGTLSWADNDMTPKSIEIAILLDALEEGDENLSITLTDVAGPTALGTLSTATLTIVDTPSDGVGALQFSSPQYAVHEEIGETTISVDRIGGKNGTVSVNYAALDETALAESDYTLESSTLIWRNGDAQSKTFSVLINKDAEPEDEETLILKLSNSLGGALLGANKTAVLRIIDSLGSPNTLLSPGILQFTAPRYPLTEDSGDITLEVSRTEGSHGQVTVNYAPQDRSAIAGNDYVATASILNWADGEAENKNIIVSIVSDTLSEPYETFTVNLSNPTGNASLGEILLTTLTIEDTLGTPVTMLPPGQSRGILQFTEAQYQIGENKGGVTITVARSDGNDGDIRVNYTTTDNTATEQDYIATQGILSWLDGEDGEKSFDIDVLNDVLVEGDEELLLALANPTNNAKLGSNAQATLTITDDDVTLMQFSSGNYLVNENDKSVTVTISRDGGRIGKVSVQYETLDNCKSSTDNCAIAGKDYQPVSGTLSWVNGQRGNKTFTISLLDDREEEGNEILPLKLSILTGNAQLGTLSQTKVTIVDNESGECEPYPVVNCLLNNQGNIISDIRIGPSGTVIGGQINGQIENNGVMQDFSLGANARLTGGIVRGNIQGIDPKNPPILLGVEIAAGSILSHLIVGKGSMVDDSVKLGEGVFFESNSLIPYMADLNESLGYISISGLEMKAIKLTSDVLFHSNIDGIVSAINGLYQLADANFSLKQNPDNGYLTLDIESFIHYAVLPMQVRQVWGTNVKTKELSPLGLTVKLDGEVIFITHTGREIKTLPVVQDPQALRKALSILGLNQMTLLSNGNLEIPVSDDAYYMARPNLFSENLFDKNSPDNILGINGTDSPWLSNVTDIFLVFEARDKSNTQLSESETDILSEFSTDRETSSGSPLVLRKQFMYPAAAYPEALYASSEISDDQTALCNEDGQRTKLYNDGRICIYTGEGSQKSTYKGILDYFIIKGTPPEDSQLKIEIAEDFNQDGYEDYRITYPNGHRQNMYQCPNCFE